MVENAWPIPIEEGNITSGQFWLAMSSVFITNCIGFFIA
jgi:hypothetical protein